MYDGLAGGAVGDGGAQGVWGGMGAAQPRGVWGSPVSMGREGRRGTVGCLGRWITGGGYSGVGGAAGCGGQEMGLGVGGCGCRSGGLGGHTLSPPLSLPQGRTRRGAGMLPPSKERLRGTGEKPGGRQARPPRQSWRVLAERNQSVAPVGVWVESAPGQPEESLAFVSALAGVPGTIWADGSHQGCL